MPAAREGGRVLLVDDDADTLETWTQLLRLSGYEVMAAQSGAAALGLATECRPHVVILDLSMPDMDGYVLAGRLGEVLSVEPPRIIALTGWADSKTRERSLRAGFERHLVKPVTLDALLEAMAGHQPIEVRGLPSPGSD